MPRPQNRSDLTTKIHLDNGSPLPLYEQLKLAILEAVQRGRITPNQRLPSENTLSRKLKISRMSVHRAYQELAQQGILFARPGKGTYLGTLPVQQDLTDLAGFTADLESKGRKVQSRILEARILAASSLLAEQMEIPVGEEVVLLDRVRMVDGQPLAREKVFLPHRLLPGLLNHDLEHGSLFKTLREFYGRDPHHAEETMAVSIADREISRFLEIKIGDPIFYMERTTRLADQRIIEYGLSWRRGDRCRYRVQIGERPVFTMDLQAVDTSSVPALG
ncbi:MAG: GntR family transcriptional regulator [Chloroflexi bacterium]|nr:GntR family transcriptional regulator [Chloroflexota bacterium]